MRRLYIAITLLVVTLFYGTANSFDYPKIGKLKGDINAFLFPTDNGNYPSYLQEKFKDSKSDGTSPMFDGLKNIFYKNEVVHIVLLLKLAPQERVEYAVKMTSSDSNKVDYGPFSLLGGYDPSINCGIITIPKKDIASSNVYLIKVLVKNSVGKTGELVTEFMIKE